jgi:hypothetical protein
LQVVQVVQVLMDKLYQYHDDDDDTNASSNVSTAIHQRSSSAKRSHDDEKASSGIVAKRARLASLALPSDQATTTTTTTTTTVPSSSVIGHRHQGRIRSFPHVVGNYPTFVYLQVSPIDHVFHACTTELLDRLGTAVQHRIAPTEYHVSLSVPFAIKRALFEELTIGIKHEVEHTARFGMSFDRWQILSNIERTRSFVALQMSHGASNVCELISLVDSVLATLRLPQYHKV